MMTAAVFALVGAVLGALGTLAVEVIRERAESSKARREALRSVCADFTTAVAHLRNLAIDLIQSPADADLMNSMNQAHRESRALYEQLRLTAGAVSVQAAGRRVLRYAYGVLRQAEGKPPREDELERGPILMLNDSLMVLYAEVRREIGTPHAADVYQEPDEWVQPSVADSAGRSRHIQGLPDLDTSGSPSLEEQTQTE